MRLRTFAILVCVAVIGAACTSGSSTSSGSSPTAVTPTRTPSPMPEPPMIPMSAPRFGKLPDIPLITTGTYLGPSTPHSLDGVLVGPTIAHYLDDPAVRSALEERGFVVIPGGDYRLFWHAYEAADYYDNTAYVTTDVAYHYWHLAFDKVLRTIEQDVLLPKLEDLLTGLVQNATTQAAQLKNGPSGPDALKVQELFQVAASLVGAPAGSLDAKSQAELTLIRAHAEMKRSPILGTEVDYSLFTPRGHYTRTPELTRYFLGMSLLGQTPFLVDPARPALLRPAVLATRALLPQGIGSPQLLALWKDIYEPTGFLVGSADDYTPPEVAKILAAQASNGLEHPTFLTDAYLATVASALLASREVRIDPESPSVRLMGTRFTLDSWVLDQLLYPNVGTETKPRVVASAVDVAAAFDDPLAAKIQRDTGQHEYLHFGKMAKEMRQGVASRPEAAWSGTVYDGWLWALQPVWTKHGEAYPDYMRTGAWAAKALQTGLASYAELKHDTLLYTKQAAGEGGDGGRAFVPRHWVEPDPVVFERLAAVIDLMRTGLGGRGLLTDEADGLLADLGDLESFLGRIARDELAGDPISTADNERLRSIGSELEGLWWRTSDQGTSAGGTLDDDAAIIADIARAQDEVVEVGTGRIELILVLVPDDRGVFQVAQGAVYTYYEFLQPLSNRLSDEEWRQMLDSGNVPDRPAWTGAFLP